MRSTAKSFSGVKEFILIRHVESVKNIEHQYASVEGLEPITMKGEHQIIELIHLIENEIIGKDVKIITAPEIRCRMTAEAISRHFNYKYELSTNIASFSSCETSGAKIIRVREENVEYGKQLELYRAGLISGEEVNWPAGSIEILENRISEFIDTCFSYSQRSIWIVAHKSSITCIVMELLKKYGNYPQGFYGYIEIPVGSGIIIHLYHKKVTNISLLKSEKNYYGYI